MDKSSWILQFCAVLVNKFATVPISTRGGTGSRQSFGRACPSLWLKESLSGFPCYTTTLGYRAAPSLADDIFVTLSAVLDEVIYEISFIVGNSVQSRLYCTW